MVKRKDGGRRVDSVAGVGVSVPEVGGGVERGVTSGTVVITGSVGVPDCVVKV